MYMKLWDRPGYGRALEIFLYIERFSIDSKQRWFIYEGLHWDVPGSLYATHLEQQLLMPMVAYDGWRARCQAYLSISELIFEPFLLLLSFIFEVSLLVFIAHLYDFIRMTSSLWRVYLISCWWCTMVVLMVFRKADFLHIQTNVIH